jgi:hypothetical protein
MSDLSIILLTLFSAFLSGLGVSVFAFFSDIKKRKEHLAEREQDLLKIELKDLEIKLYKLEKDLAEWKDKYYETIEELISVRAELEETLIKLSIIHLNYEE